MIKIENTEVVGWEAAIRGMRNPMNSWSKSDSIFTRHVSDNTVCLVDICGNTLPPCSWSKTVHEDNKTGLFYNIGDNDHDLMMRLAKGGSVHAKYRRMIAVYVDITAPLYWWKEFDTYKVGTVANSCSTMHKIHEKEFTLEDFSCEHLLGFDGPHNDEREVPYIPIDHDDISPLGLYKCGIIPMLNLCRKRYLEIDRDIKLERDKALNMNSSEPMADVKEIKKKQKEVWWQMIQLLPSSYNQRRTVMLNYEVLAGIYTWRKDHKLDEWREFCRWIESLPHSEIITLKESEG